MINRLMKIIAIKCSSHDFDLLQSRDVIVHVAI